MAWMKTKIKIPTKLNSEEREALALDILDRIVKRTVEENKDKDGKKFPPYSSSYKKSLDFKIGGKTSKVDLTLSGDMLADLKLLGHKKGEVTIGYENHTDSNAKAEGNIKGTYGKSVPNPAKARDFLGVSRNELIDIIEPYKKKDSRIERVKELYDLMQGAEELTARIVLDELED